MIRSNRACPSCGSRRVQEVIYGYPSPEDLEQVALGRAILAGPQPYDAMPTLRCADCEHWWQAGSSTGGPFSTPATCHFCGEPLSEPDKIRFETNVANYWRRKDGDRSAHSGALFAYYPLPTCQHCVREIRAAQAESQQEKRVRAALELRVKAAGFVVLILGIVMAMAMHWLGWLQ